MKQGIARQGKKFTDTDEASGSRKHFFAAVGAREVSTCATNVSSARAALTRVRRPRPYWPSPWAACRGHVHTGQAHGQNVDADKILDSDARVMKTLVMAICRNLQQQFANCTPLAMCKAQNVRSDLHNVETGKYSGGGQYAAAAGATVACSGR